jgi:glycosyltransferase involved in cell wall biosynthesis
VGDVIPRKGAIYLVQALPEILARHPHAMIALVGSEGPASYIEKIKTTAKQLGVSSRILWLGRRSDVPEILPAMDLWTLPSLEESLPLALLEAMAAGLPVVASAVGGIPECITSEKTGLLVPPGKSHALAQAIVGLLDDERRRHAIGAAASQWIRQQFSLDSQTSRIETALASVARRAA